MKEAVSNASGGLQAAFDDNSNSKADSNPGAMMPEKPKVGEVSISLDFRVTMKEKGKKHFLMAEIKVRATVLNLLPQVHFLALGLDQNLDLILDPRQKMLLLLLKMTIPKELFWGKGIELFLCENYRNVECFLCR